MQSKKFESESKRAEKDQKKGKKYKIRNGESKISFKKK